MPETAAAELPNALPCSAATAGLTIADETWAIVGSKAPNGYLVTIRTVSGSTTSTRSIIVKSDSRLWFATGSSTRAKLSRTASASNGVPSWKRTPLRKWNVQVTPSSATLQRSARRGPIFIWSSKAMSGSYTIMITWSDSVSVVLCGSSVVASAAAAKISWSRAGPPGAPPRQAAAAARASSQDDHAPVDDGWRRVEHGANYRTHRPDRRPDAAGRDPQIR